MSWMKLGWQPCLQSRAVICDWRTLQQITKGMRQSKLTSNLCMSFCFILLQWLQNTSQR